VFLSTKPVFLGTKLRVYKYHGFHYNIDKYRKYVPHNDLNTLLTQFNTLVQNPKRASQQKKQKFPSDERPKYPKKLKSNADTPVQTSRTVLLF